MEQNGKDKAAQFKEDIKHISFLMDYLRSKEDAIEAYGESPAEFAAEFEELVNEVARLTGADPEQIKDKNKRTIEQEELLEMAAIRRRWTETSMFLVTPYFQIVLNLNNLKGKFEDPAADTWSMQGIYEISINYPRSVKEYAAFYYLYLHPEIDKLQEQLTQEQLEEATAIYWKIDSFLFNQTKGRNPAEISQEEKEDLFYLFAKNENPDLFSDAASVRSRTISKYQYPIDKLNSSIWNGIFSQNETGVQVSTANKNKKTKNKNAADESYIDLSINFDDVIKDLAIKGITQFDKRIYVACYNLQKSGNEYVTPNQIYKAMGKRNNAPLSEVKRINESLLKMNATQITASNENEYPNYKRFVYKGSMLPLEIVECWINGQFTNSAIHFLRSAPLIAEISEPRNQIITIPRKLLESPVNSSENNLKIEDYLINRIGMMKHNGGNGKAQNKILYKTLFEKCGIETKKQKQRAKEIIFRLLDHYITAESDYWIAGYTAQEDGIYIDIK